MSKVMFISGSIGMGHVTRDLAMANEFRKLQPDAEVVWLAGEPAVTFLKEGGRSFCPRPAITTEKRTTSSVMQATSP